MRISNINNMLENNYMGGEVEDFSRSNSQKRVEDHIFIPKNFIPEGLGDYTEEHRLELRTNGKLDDFLSDDEFELLFSGDFEKDLVFNAFYEMLENAKVVKVKFDKNNNKIYSRDIENFYKRLVCLYDATFEDVEKLGALSFLKGVVNVMNYISVEQLSELSAKQIMQLADTEDVRQIKEKYNSIINHRHTLNKDDFRLYVNMLENNHNFDNMKTARVLYNYISLIYNGNTALQDNVEYENYLNKMSEYSETSILKMRVSNILDLFGLSDTDFEIAKGTNEELLDSEGFGYCTL